MFRKIIFFIHFFLTFFGAILASILELFGDQKSSILAIFRSQNRGCETLPPPFISYMLPSALRTPKMCRKGLQNAPKMSPKCPQEASKSLKFGDLEPSLLPCYVTHDDRLFLQSITASFKLTYLYTVQEISNSKLLDT